MINIIYTVIRDQFRLWVQGRTNERNERLVEENFVEMDAEVAAAFRQSTHISGKYKL